MGREGVREEKGGWAGADSESTRSPSRSCLLGGVFFGNVQQLHTQLSHRFTVGMFGLPTVERSKHTGSPTYPASIHSSW